MSKNQPLLGFEPTTTGIPNGQKSIFARIGPLAVRLKKNELLLWSGTLLGIKLLVFSKNGAPMHKLTNFRHQYL